MTTTIKGFAVAQLLEGRTEWNITSKIYPSIEEAQKFVDWAESKNDGFYWTKRKYQIVKVEN